MRISDWSSDVCSSDLEAEYALGRAALAEGAEVVAEDQAGGGAEVDDVLVDRYGALHRRLVVAVGVQDLLVPGLGAEGDLGRDLHQAGGVGGAVELDHPEAAALGADDHVVVDDDRRRVPVVVPAGGADLLGVELPEHLGLAGPVEGDAPEVVGPGAGVDGWEAGGVAIGGATGEV